MLKYGSQLQREEEKQQVLALGYSIHSPKDDKEINDKQNQTEESNNGLAEKIVKKDTDGIISSDIILIEPHENALGTMVELGQIHGQKNMAQIIQDIVNQGDGTNDTLLKISDLCNKFINKPVYPYIRDVRRTDIPECGDRRSWAVNQYVHGICLDLTNGKGLYEWEEILKELNNE